VGDGGGDDDRGGRVEADGLRLECHLAAAAHDQEDLEQIAVTMGADGPVVDRGPRGDRLDVDEVERLVVRRIAVEMKQRQGGTASHAPQCRATGASAQRFRTISREIKEFRARRSTG
jgi:hypothetical protein